LTKAARAPARLASACDTSVARQFADAETVLCRFELSVEHLRLILIKVDQGLGFEHVEVGGCDLEQHLRLGRLQPRPLGDHLIFRLGNAGDRFEAAKKRLRDRCSQLFRGQSAGTDHNRQRRSAAPIPLMPP